MKIVVNHLTRMKNGRICVAGVDLDTSKHIRPILTSGLSKDLLERNGGPFDIANLIELGSIRPHPQRPKMENHYFALSKVRKIRIAESADFWKVQESMSEDDWTAIFGNKLVLGKNDDKAYLPEGTGKASLGCLRPIGKPSIYTSTVGDKTALKIQVKAKFAGVEMNFELPLTDIRFYKDDHATPDESMLKRAYKNLISDQVILGVGVGYAMSANRNYESAHWLQVNAVHFSSNPTWQLG